MPSGRLSRNGISIGVSAVPWAQSALCVSPVTPRPINHSLPSPFSLPSSFSADFGLFMNAAGTDGKFFITAATSTGVWKNDIIAAIGQLVPWLDIMVRVEDWGRTGCGIDAACLHGRDCGVCRAGRRKSWFLRTSVAQRVFHH